MELWPGVHLVGSGRNGFDLSDPFDCHIYLIDGGSEAALVDAGAGIEVRALVEQIEAAIEPARLTTLLLTHKHADHAGGAAALRERYGLRTVASAHTAEVVAAADMERLSLADAKRAGVYPASYSFRACPVDRVVTDGDLVTVGSMTLRALATPGHCDGHMAFLGEIGGRTALFAGDSLFHGGRVVWQATYDCSVQEHIESIRKLAGVPFDALLPGHLAISLTRGHRHVAAALERIAHLDVPQHLV